MFLQNLKYAVRQLRSSWGFAILAILTLALGIGANTAMFTVVENVLLRPLAYAHADRLVTIGSGMTSEDQTSYLNLRDVQEQAKHLDGAAIYGIDLSVVQGKDGSDSVVAPHVSDNLFSVLGAHPLLGRTFTPEEASPGGPHVVLLAQGLWKQQFGSDPNIVGRSVNVGGIPHTVIGVMPSSFTFPDEEGASVQDGIWLPLQLSQEMRTDRGYSFFRMVAAMRPGATVAQVQSELDAIVSRIRQADPKETEGLNLHAMTYQESITGQMRPVFLALLGALVLVLLIACANVSNLLIARCLGRKQEFAVRAALGASRWRMVRQLLAEGAVLSVLGCAVGLLLARLALLTLQKLPQDTIPRADSIHLDWTVVLILAAIASLTTVLSSLLPALLVARTNPQPALQAASRGIGARSVSGRLSGWLVSGEVALSTLLLVATGLLFHTFWNLEHVPLGFDSDRVTTFPAMPADAAGFSSMAVAADTTNAPISVATTIYQPSLDRISHLPGVRYAAVATSPPLSGMNMSTSFEVVGHPTTSGDHPKSRLTAASEDYAALLGTPLLRGRMISASDTAGTPLVAVINEALAKKYFPDKDPLQQQLDLGGKETGMPQPLTIVGVIANQADIGVGQDVQPFILIPYRQVPTTSLFYQALLKTRVSFMVKTLGTMHVAPQMRAIFAQTAPGYAIDNFSTMQETIDGKIFSQRLGLYLTASFAALAIVMVIAGLYGVLAQLVSYRRREIGVRMALGATRENIARMILRQGGILIVAGLVAGLVLSVFTGQLVKSFLYHVKPVDLGTYVAVAVLLLIIGSVASLIPAHAASTIEPMEALRDD